MSKGSRSHENETPVVRRYWSGLDMTFKTESLEKEAERDKTHKIKVAIVLMYFGYGGAEKMVSLLASNIDLKLFDVRVFCVYGGPQDNAMEKALVDRHIPIIYVGKGRGPSIRAIRILSSALSDFRPDIIHSHLNGALYAAPWALSNRVTMLHTLHNIPQKEAGVARRCLMRYLYSSGVAIPVAISLVNQQMTADYYSLSLDQVHMVHNPVDINKMQYSQCEKKFDICCIARFQEQKNHEMLIRATASLNKEGVEVNLALAGQGPLENRLRDLVADLGIGSHVEFLGVLDEIPQLLAQSKLFVLSSNYEGLPMTILEAMAAGVPVIATRVGGIPDVIEDGGNGVLVNPGDVDGLAAAVRRLLEDPYEANRYAEKALLDVRKYGIDEVAKQYMDLYRLHVKEAKRGSIL